MTCMCYNQTFDDFKENSHYNVRKSYISCNVCIFLMTVSINQVM